MVGKDELTRSKLMGTHLVSATLPCLTRGLPSNVVNGQTPQGVHTIDSVMPEANRQISLESLEETEQ